MIVFKGLEAIESHELSFKVAKKKEDKAQALYNKGMSCQMLGLLDDACQAFQQSLIINPDDVKPYMALVESLIENNAYSTEEWELLLTEISSIEASLVVRNANVPGEIYRSLHYILHHLHRYSEAWIHIEKANQVDLTNKASRGQRYANYPSRNSASCDLHFKINRYIYSATL